MLSSGTRIAGGMACRAQMQCALRRVPARVPQMTTSRATARLQTAWAGRAQTQLAQYRPFSISVPRSKDEVAEAAEVADEAKDAVEDTSPAAVETQAVEAALTPTDTPGAPDDDVPWYLRVKVPKHEMLTPQTTPLPDIPANAPSLLAPLVTFAADDLGLDDLKILDLRNLDPPAGLGPDLIMLFSTSRSERHLHVSADRLVRWFRTYGVNASADGLLGRNELKIKLKRKARRAKLLGNIGQLAAGTSEEVDDGISTKWVCVNAGFIGGRGKGGSKDDPNKERKGPPLGEAKEGAKFAEQAVVDAKGRTTGFGSARSAGTTVVIQIFTEGKRKQMELEQLWTKTLWHSLRKRRGAGEDVKAQLKALESEMKMDEDELDKENDDWLAGLPTGEASASAAPTNPLGSSF